MSPCSTCSTLTNCTTCIDTKFLMNGACYSSCPPNYVAVNQICVYQQTCTGYILNNTCLANCPYGTYSLEINGINTCQPCSTSCLSCVSSTSCLNCASGTFLLTVNTSTVSNANQNETTCVSLCPLSTYMDNGQCLSCKSPCNQCSLINGQILCVTCAAGFYYLNGNCLATCPSGYYQSVASLSCVPCLSFCLTCTNSTGCLTCSNSIYTAPACTGNCSSGNFWSTTTNGCSACHSTCATCYGATSSQCTACKNVSGVVYQLFGSQCVTVCPNGYYSAGSICYSCTVANCVTCLNNVLSANCTVCSAGYILAYLPSNQSSVCTNTCQ